MLGAIAYAKFTGISDEKIKKDWKNKFYQRQDGKINEGQEFDVVVDYAHTPIH